MMNADSTTMPGRPPIVDRDEWDAQREALLVREKAHTHEGDAIAAARRALPMVEFDGSVEVVGADGPVPFISLFEGREELVVYKHMWHDGAPHQGQCEGCTVSAWNLRDASYLYARGVSFAILTEAYGANFALLDMTPYGRRESWEQNPEGWSEGHGACWHWRRNFEGVTGWAVDSRPTPQWTRPGAGPVTSLGRQQRG